ncbi:MAG: TIGR02444 family protein [Rhodospirillales bacterium]|nr:TIGR02444 family protein [Rhodospirillales bacterium]
MGEFNWPDDDFWEFSLSVYGEKGVAPACLELQTRHGVDVNLLLYMAWAGARGHRLNADELAAAEDAVQRWHREIVVPLRILRSELKTDTKGAPVGLSEHIRSGIKSAELDAERAEQLMLAAVIERLSNPGGEDAAAGLTNMRAYLSRFGGKLNEADEAGIALLAGAAALKTAS